MYTVKSWWLLEKPPVELNRSEGNSLSRLLVTMKVGRNHLPRDEFENWRRSTQAATLVASSRVPSLQGLSINLFFFAGISIPVLGQRSLLSIVREGYH